MPELDSVEQVQTSGLLIMAAEEWDRRSHDALYGGDTEGYKIAYTAWRAVRVAARRSVETTGLYDPEFEDAEPLNHVERFGNLDVLERSVTILKEEYQQRLRGVSNGGLLQALISEVSLNAVRTALEEARK